MANRPPRPHERPPPSRSADRRHQPGAKDTRGRPVEPQWVYNWQTAQELGRGSFGIVYSVVKNDLSPLALKQTTVAVKCVDKKQGGVKGAELLALTTLAMDRHTNIVAYYGKSECQMGKVMYDCFEFEYIDGGDLFHYLWDYNRTGNNMPTTTVTYFTRQILKGVKFIHDKGFAHRDIKPENIMLTRDWVVKITDFGLALKIPHGRKYTVGGTLPYLAPELFSDGIQGYAADIWAVGVIVFNLYFKGNYPFQIVNKTVITNQVRALYPQLYRDRNFDGVLNRERELVTDHYRKPDWPWGTDDWYETHQDAYDFIEKLLRVSHARRITADRALAEPWIKAIEPKPQQQQPLPRPLSPAEAAKDRKVTGLAKLQAAIKPKRKDGRKSKISRFLDKHTKG